jgi:alkaline phosphatase
MNIRTAALTLPYLLGLVTVIGCRHASYIAPEDTGTSEVQPTDSLVADAGVGWDAPKNVLLFIGDGMGPNQIAAAGMYENGEAGTLYFESFPVHGLVANDSASYPTVTDSAAAATAIACGVKVQNYTVALAIPGDGGELFCLVDYYKRLRKSSGLVTTTYITHATPAPFAAHAKDRYDADTIAWHYLNTGRPEILFGGGGFGMVPEEVIAAGYSVINSLDNFVVPANVETPRVAGLFGEGYYPYEASGPLDRPHLYESAVTAVDLLSRDSDGFFAMIEGGMIDQAEHINRS